MILKKDNFFLGLFLGLFLPLILFILSGFFKKELKFALDDSTLYVISCIINLPIFRILILNFNKEKTGRGVLFSTFLLMFFYLYKYM
tara:strand:+ start:868 stop:1128 length:261 start_codon:yes stop_codon:yes gene_type:complete